MAEKLVVFDLDGTLLDTLEDIRGEINYALSAWCVPKVEKEKIRLYVGHGLRNALFTALDNSGHKVPEEDLPLMVDLMMSCYRNHPSDYTTPYPGVVDMLHHLKNGGFKMGVISNKSEELVIRIVKNILPSVDFDFVLGQSDRYPLKPNPESLLTMMREYRVDKDSIIYIGDSEVDYLTANNAGVKSIIVNYGFRTKEELERSGVMESVNDVSALLSRIEEFFSCRQ